MRVTTVPGVATSLLLRLLMFGSAAHAGEPAADRPLAPLAFLAGYCWNGTFADGKTTDEHCYEWVYGGKFLRDRHLVRGGPQPYQGESLYFWDGEQKALAYIYFNSDGGVSRGTLKIEGDTLLFPTERYSEGATTREFSTTLMRDGDERYATVTHELTKGTRVEAWRTAFRRGTALSSAAGSDPR